ncbi:MAG TPA: TlpA family protein disulfide reductase [Anaerolineae bacterium]|nr:TlpA family protein disulfide reductase [Anaerolineae bacterium]
MNSSTSFSDTNNLTDTPQATATSQASLIWRGLIGLAMLTVLLLLAWGVYNNEFVSRPIAGAEAPDFELVYFDGYGWQDMSANNLSDFEGKVVVLNFWASWCVECLYEAELLENTWRQYHQAGDDVIFLGVAYVDIEKDSREYLQQFDITYPNGLDLRGQISHAYRITGVPETFYIDKTGEIAHITIGPVGERELTSTIERLLAQ